MRPGIEQTDNCLLAFIEMAPYRFKQGHAVRFKNWTIRFKIGMVISGRVYRIPPSPRSIYLGLAQDLDPITMNYRLASRAPMIGSHEVPNDRPASGGYALQAFLQRVGSGRMKSVSKPPSYVPRTPYLAFTLPREYTLLSL